ncbi:MAG: choice-of-anchor tandem repeat GloVer-containing protein [Candidatus Cybelea sp.]
MRYASAFTLTLLVAGCGQPTVFNGSPPSAARQFSRTTGYTEAVLHRFKSSPDAASPEAGVFVDKGGNVYGTTIAGGAYPGCPGGYNQGCGTIFEIDTAGKEHLVYSFAGDPDASEPFAGLLKSNGVFYGTTAAGGDYYPCYVYGGLGCGVVFKIDRRGRESILHNFEGNFGSGKADGMDARGSLVSDPSGNLYGTTPYGGHYNYGTIFKVTKAGKETVLYSFMGETDGGRPYAGVLRDAAGNLYGVAYAGAESACTGGCGTIFELKASGSLKTLYEFTGKEDGGNPYGGMAMDGSGNLYGTAQNYGNLSCNKRGGNPGCGTVFRFSTKGKFTMLHVFAGSPDGAVPSENLIVDAGGNLYGTTSFGGDSSCNGGYSCGTVFEINSQGYEYVLHTFTGGKHDGEVPYGPVARDATGNLYGTTVSGGIGPCNRGCGIVFKLSPGP